ncbi:hypothetical protein KEM56_004930 [Ascosphaera pollenicola]|nr:hypothetical protein KEM56_004930 [Ascosphaera pollenicola]
MGRSGQLEPSRLTKLEFNRCTEPWAASSLVAWLKDLAASVTEMSKDDVTKCLLLLIQNKTPTIALLDAEKIAGQVVNDMLAQGVLEGTEPELKFTEATLSGVFWQLTGHGCYSLNVHGSKAKLLGNTRCACYSRTCMRQKQHRLLYGDLGKLWQDFWGIKHQNISHEENEYQNAIRELVKVTHTNWKWLDFLNTTVNEYLRKKDPALILAMKSEVAQKFVQDVFGHFPDTAKAVKEYFLLPLRAREVEQGPYVRNISDIVIEFTKRARPAFTNDIGARNRANFLFARQRDLNETFKLFATVTLYKLPERIGWGEIVAISVKFPSSIIATLEKMKKYCSDPVEKENIDVALKELNAMLHHLNTKQDEAERTGQPRALASILTISSKIAPFKKDDLLLNERGRQVIYDKELSRPTSSAVRFGQMSRIRGILLDNYMLFAKTKYFRTDEPTSQVYEYVVDRPPIPIRMLALEWPNDDGGSKNVLGLNARNQVHHTPAGGMMTAGSAPPVTILSEDPERTLFPFTIKHLGGESHEVYASSRKLRESWCDHIKQALQSHVKSARPSEPFRLRVLADNSFVYSQDQSSAPRRLYVKGTALYDAIREVEAKYPDSHSRGSPVARGDCLCSTVFNDVDNVVRCYIGTTTGLYISDYDNPRGWQKVSEVNGPVEQVAVMEDFRLVITLGSGNLFAWEMGTIDNPSSSSLQSPEVLSGGNPFLFTIGRLDDRIWVAYAKEAKMGSTVLKYTEPVLSQSASLRRRIFNHRNPTQHFRKFDGDVPYANGNLIDAVFFTKTVALVMNNEIRLGKGKDTVRMQAVPVGIDDPRISPESSHIFSLIRQSEARAIFKLDSRSFILVYTKCAVIVNANAQITRHQPHFFAGVFNSVRLYKGYLILIYDDFIEILNAQDGRQRQIISGRNIRLLTDRGYYDQTSTNPDPNKVREATVKVAMQHPEEPRNQLVVELVLA